MPPEQTAPAPVVQQPPGLLPPGAGVVAPDRPLPPPPSSAVETVEPNPEILAAGQDTPDELPEDLPDIELAPAVSEPAPAQEPEGAPEPVGPQANGTAPNKALQRLQRQEKATAACLSGLDQHNAQIQNLEATQKLLGRNILILAGGVAVCLYMLNKAGKLPQPPEVTDIAETIVDATS